MSSKRLGIYSMEITLGRPDGRTREGRLLREARRALVEALGGEGNLTLPQEALVTRAATLQLRLAVMDREALSGNLSGHSAREYVATTNALVKILGQLGLTKPPPPEKPAPVDPMDAIRAHIARRRAESEAA